MGQIRERFPAVFALLSEAGAEAVVTGVQSSVLAGRDLTADAVQRIAGCLTGKLTREECHAAVVELATAEAAR